jgi:hypothetical protein
MSLPKIDVPTYQIKVPSNGKEITIRPFLVKEEKLLLIAAQSNDENEVINTTKQIINNCIVDGDINVDALPFFDIDYIFIALRAKSIGESVDISFTCNNTVGDEVCGNRFTAKIDVSDCEIIKNENIKQEITLSGSLRLKMKYPSYAVMKTLNDDELTIEKKIKIMVASVDQVVEKDKIYTSKDFTRDELKDFIEGLTQEQFRKLEEYVDNFPTFVVNSKAKCSKCEYEHNIKYDNFSSFFF